MTIETATAALHVRLIHVVACRTEVHDALWFVLLMVCGLANCDLLF